MRNSMYAGYYTPRRKILQTERRPALIISWVIASNRRRNKADLSMCYKIINNHTCIQFASSFTFSLSSKTRGNSRKLDKSHVLSFDCS